VGKENGEEGASGGSFLTGGERKGGVAGLARHHVERGSGRGIGARSAFGPYGWDDSGWRCRRRHRVLAAEAGW
jgi:hypothetical protein